MPANTLFVLPTGTTDITFSQIRDMYNQGNGSSNGFKKYYRNGSFVVSTTYNTVYNPFNNTAGSIPESGEIKMSQFRGAFKEHRFDT